MLEIDKMQERFPERSGFILREYAQDFSKPDTRKEIPPNPPVAPPSTQELFDASSCNTSPKSGPKPL
jgi:hypothetical protein